MHFSHSLAATVLLLLSVSLAPAVVPEHSVENEAVHLTSVGPDNPVLYDNDWWFDVFDNDYLWAQASLGRANQLGDDGRFMLFQDGRGGMESGQGFSICLYDFEKARRAR